MIAQRKCSGNAGGDTVTEDESPLPGHRHLPDSPGTHGLDRRSRRAAAIVSAEKP